MALLVLRPDAQNPVPLQRSEAPPLPPGTIAVLSSSIWSIDDDLATLSAFASRHPWVPAVIIEDAATPPRGLGPEAIYLLAACCDVQRVVPPPPPPGQRSAIELGSLIRQAVRLRPVPTGEQIGRYFARCVPESARSDVVRALTGAADRALSRRLVHRGLPPARDWRVGGRILRAVAHGIRDGRIEYSAAAAVGLQVKALSIACGRHFGAPWRDLVAVGVWEGVAELFLRAHRRALGTTGRVRTMVG